MQAVMRQGHDDQVTLLDKLGASKDHVSASIAQRAKLGTCDKYENNVRRDLVHLLGDMNIPDPFFLDSPMAKVKSPDGAPSAQSRPFPIMLPHEMFSCLCHEYPDRFHDIFLERRHRTKGPAHQVLRYVRARRLDAMCSAPVCVHGDAVPRLPTGKAGTESFDVLSMQGLLSHGTHENREALHSSAGCSSTTQSRTTQVCVQCGRLSNIRHGCHGTFVLCRSHCVPMFRMHVALCVKHV